MKEVVPDTTYQPQKPSFSRLTFAVRERSPAKFPGCHDLLARGVVGEIVDSVCKLGCALRFKFSPQGVSEGVPVCFCVTISFHKEACVFQRALESGECDEK